MKRTPIPWILLPGLYVVFFILLAVSAAHLPETMATHFGLTGRPNDWMSRSGYLGMMVAFGLFFPLFVVGLSYVSRFFPDQCQNIPRREYWLAAGKREETFDYLVQHSLWFACLALGFVMGIHLLVIAANTGSQHGLSTAGIFGLAAVFLAGTIGWGITMLRHFQHDH